MNKNIDIKKCNIILKEWKESEEIIEKQNAILKEKEKEIKDLLPKNYWWTYDIDKSWNKAKKYSIKEVSVCNGKIYITVKEVFKKTPWKGYDGKRTYSLDKFMELNIYKTEKEADTAYCNRICPKCGGIMNYSPYKWCEKCINERAKKRKEFNDKHVFYCLEDDSTYRVAYTDELTRDIDKGFGGKHFIIQRMDTMEIMHTDNLWSWMSNDVDRETLPRIKFLNEE